MRISSFIALFALVSTVGFSQGEPLTFKDVPLGMSLADFTSKFKREVKGSSRSAPHLNFGTIFSVPTRQVFTPVNRRDSGLVLASKTFPFEDRREGRDGKNNANDTIAGVSADVGYWFNASNSKDWDLAADPYLQTSLSGDKTPGKMEMKGWDDWTPEQKEAAERIHLGMIRAEFDAASFEAVIAALETKFGKPSKRETETYQNGMGATRSGEVVTWNKGEDFVITATERAGRVDRSSVVMAQGSILNRSKSYVKEAAKGNSADL